MTVEEILIEKIKALPQSRKQEILDFTEFRSEKNEILPPRAKRTKAVSKAVLGIWSDIDDPIEYAIQIREKNRGK